MKMRHMNLVIPSADLDRSIKFWIEGLEFELVHEIRAKGKLIWCMLRGHGQFVQLNQRVGNEEVPENYEGIRVYWEPEDLDATQQRLLKLGFAVGDQQDRSHGRREFLVIDADQFTHCFGVSL